MSVPSLLVKVAQGWFSHSAIFPPFLEMMKQPRATQTGCHLQTQQDGRGGGWCLIAQVSTVLGTTNQNAWLQDKRGPALAVPVLRVERYQNSPDAFSQKPGCRVPTLCFGSSSSGGGGPEDVHF